MNREGDASLLFPPLYEEEAEAKTALLHVIHRDPRCCVVAHTRWQLADVHAQFPHWKPGSLAAVSRLLKRWHISYKRARAHVHSPDPAYEPKWEVIKQHDGQVRTSTGREVLL